MGIKSKVLGFIAAAGLSLSLIASAGAQAATTSDGTATLADGDCVVWVTAGDMDFGEYAYSGVTDGWYNYFGSAFIEFNLVVNQYDEQCGLTVSTDGLTHETDSTVIIGGEHVFASYMTSPSSLVGSNLPFSMEVIEPTGQLTDSIQLDVLELPGSFIPGVYEGTFEVTASNDAP